MLPLLIFQKSRRKLISVTHSRKEKSKCTVCLVEIILMGLLVSNK